MSDKEKIKEEIERRIVKAEEFAERAEGANDDSSKLSWDFVATQNKSLIQFIDSLPEEPKKQPKFKVGDTIKGPCNNIFQVKEVLNKQYLLHSENGDELNSIEIVDKYSCISEEPASEDLDEEIENYIKDSLAIKFPTTDKEQIKSDIRYIARHFAEWQKQQYEELFSKDSWTYIEENYPDITEEEKLRLYDISIKSRLAGANAIKQQMKEALQTEYEKGRYDMREEIMKTLIGGEVVKDVHNQLCVKSKPLNDTFRDVKFGDKVKITIVKED